MKQNKLRQFDERKKGDIKAINYITKNVTMLYLLNY